MENSSDAKLLKTGLVEKDKKNLGTKLFKNYCLGTPTTGLQPKD